MSRTYKDRPKEVRFPALNIDKFEAIPYVRPYYEYGTGIPKERASFYHVQSPGILPKKAKNIDTEYRWMTTPSWFRRVFMNIPDRRTMRAWERKVLLEDLDETDPPPMYCTEEYYW